MYQRRHFQRLAATNKTPPAEKSSSTPTTTKIKLYWNKREQGFAFPPEAGYPLDTAQARFYLMETHYINPRNAEEFGNWNQRQKADSSGLKLYYTDKLRKFDAGVLSVGKFVNAKEKWK